MKYIFIKVENIGPLSCNDIYFEYFSWQKGKWFSPKLKWTMNNIFFIILNHFLNIFTRFGNQVFFIFIMLLNNIVLSIQKLINKLIFAKIFELRSIHIIITIYFIIFKKRVFCV